MMTEQPRSVDSESGFIQKYWNEFLFAREFEYETVLSPDEIAEALKQLEDMSHFSLWFSFVKLSHRLNYQREGDKAGQFSIHLEPRRKVWWNLHLPFQYTKGSMTVDSKTGLTTIRGRTRFSSIGYLFLLGILLFDFAVFATSSIPYGVWFITAFTIITWYLFYRERNQMADRIDNIIMNAKVEKSKDRLMDSEETDHSKFNNEEEKLKGEAQSQ